MAKDTTGRLRVTVKSGGRLKLSSKLWLERQLNDPYVAKAKRDGFRSRAAYKLDEMYDKNPFPKRGANLCGVALTRGVQANENRRQAPFPQAWRDRGRPWRRAGRLEPDRGEAGWRGRRQG